MVDVYQNLSIELPPNHLNDMNWGKYSVMAKIN